MMKIDSLDQKCTLKIQDADNGCFRIHLSELQYGRCISMLLTTDSVATIIEYLFLSKSDVTPATSLKEANWRMRNMSEAIAALQKERDELKDRIETVARKIGNGYAASGYPPMVPEPRANGLLTQIEHMLSKIPLPSTPAPQFGMDATRFEELMTIVADLNNRLPGNVQYNRIANEASRLIGQLRDITNRLLAPSAQMPGIDPNVERLQRLVNDLDKTRAPADRLLTVPGNIPALVDLLSSMIVGLRNQMIDQIEVNKRQYVFAENGRIDAEKDIHQLNVELERANRIIDALTEKRT